MLIWLQILGVVFALVMSYVTFFNYRRNEIQFSDLMVWGPIWLVFLYGVIFPRSLDILVETFNVRSAIELFTVAGFMFMVAVIFYLFKMVRQQQKKMKKIVKVIALEKLK